ncbi:Aurachin C monooxygenase/isomerase [Colletotrichum fructicola]|nr:Aurachin C monooxygenase/isomerase [Colletotrichum fructicola]
MSKDSQAAALKVLIAGAGIGGLSAAIALRQAGHAVEIFESSKFAAEVGAAIHLPPNVNVLLRQFGMNPEEHGANDAEWVTVLSSQGDIISQKSLAGLKKEFSCPWQLIHRVDLHESLKTIATSPEGWSNAASVEDLLKVFSEYCKPMQTLLGMADPSTIKLWKLFDRRVLKTWVNGYAALLGDAAHPFLPHQGQGGAQAIEDAAALSALFPMGTRKEDVKRRLGAYMKARYDRATMVQDFSRQMAFQTDEQDKVGGFSMDPMEFSKINFNHNAYVHAREILNQQL